jgi:hypothetical protein
MSQTLPAVMRRRPQMASTSVVFPLPVLPAEGAGGD